MKKLLLVVLFLAACAKQEAPAPAPAPPKAPALTVAQAKELLANAPELGEYQFTNAAVTLPMKQSQMNAPAQELAKSLRASGWIAFSGDAVVLTDKAKNDKRFLPRPNGYTDIVPIAKKEFGDVTNVSGDTATFTWHWVQNDIGNAIHKPDEAVQHATAKLMWDGKAWSVLSIQ